MAAPSTRHKLLSLIDDVEIVAKELLDYIALPKNQRTEEINTDQLIQLLVVKDKELQETLQTASEQTELQKKLDALKVEVEARDGDIKQLQRSLKEAESVLATAIYQAKQKLQSINQAKASKISSEELIKYAHKISAANAVAAPPTWAPGDPRRPYPTDIEMRMGVLAKFGDPTLSQQTLQTQASFPDPLAMGRTQLEHPLSAHHPPGGALSSWQHSVDTNSAPTGGGGGGHYSLTPPSGLDTKHHAPVKDDEVEMMSSDSSSSSSSDE